MCRRLGIMHMRDFPTTRPFEPHVGFLENLIEHLPVDLQRFYVQQIAGNGSVALRAESDLQVGYRALLNPSTGFDEFGPFLLLARKSGAAFRKPQHSVVRV